MVKALLRTLGIAAFVAAGAACTVHQTTPAAPTGPSTFARSVTMKATPDRITQDGASQSAVQVTVMGTDPITFKSAPLAGVTLRLDMAFGGQIVDFGTLSARTVVTGADGTAQTIYTAPSPSPGPNTPINTVLIRAVPIGTDAQASVNTIVAIQLMPFGVIIPTAGTPKAQFTVTPIPVNLNVAANFDGSTSCPAIDSTGNCVPNSGSSITTYAWTFGDNSAGVTGPSPTAQHTFTSTGTFTIILTVTNDRGVAASATQNIVVGSSAPPSGDWTNSPVSPVVGDKVFFNADQVLPAPGRTIVQYSWDFGDGSPGGSGFATSHVYTLANIYTVTLSVRDDAGQKIVKAHSLTVGTGNPVPVITFSPTAPKLGGGASVTVNFDSSGSTTSGGAAITTYSWSFPSGVPASSTVASPAISYTAAGGYTVRLTITDSQGRSGTTQVTVTIAP
jgi:PKD repeat protein